MGNINSAYSFVREISLCYDNKKFPNTKHRSDVPEIIKFWISKEQQVNVAKTIDSTDSPSSQAKKKFELVLQSTILPDNIQAAIANHYITNTMEWFYTTGQLRASNASLQSKSEVPKKTLRDVTIAETAKGLLGKINGPIIQELLETKAKTEGLTVKKFMENLGINDEKELVKLFQTLDLYEGREKFIQKLTMKDLIQKLGSSDEGSIKKALQIFEINTDDVNINKLLQNLVMINPKTSFTKQLWDHIFQEVYSKANIQEKQHIISLATAHNSQRMEISQWEIRVYRIGKIASYFFNNFTVKIVLAIAVWYAVGRVRDIAIEKIRASYLPELVNRFINIAPPLAVRIVSITFEWGEKIYANRLKIFLAGLVIRFGAPVFGFNHPMIAITVNRVTDLVYLPQTTVRIIRRLPWRFGVLSYNTQTKISQSLRTVYDEKLKRSLELGGRKAYALWMDLMDQATREGIVKILDRNLVKD